MVPRAQGQPLSHGRGYGRPMTPRANALETAPGFLSRVRMRVEGWVRRLLAPIDVPFSTSTFGTMVAPQYDQRTAMSTLAKHPWVRVCTRAKVDDVGGLPLVAIAGGLRGDSEGEQLRDHPFLALMRKPSPGVTETILRRQLEADLVLTGNAYLWLRQGPLGPELYRLHPSHMRADVVEGRIVRWRYAQKELSPLEVWHVHDISWSDDLTALYGETAIRTLHNGLSAVYETRAYAATQARRGRPDMLLTFPKDSGLGAEGANAVKEIYHQALDADDGVVVVGGGVTATPLNWEPKELEYKELDTRVRDETIAVMRVPATRAGIPQANYATARAELRDYWSSLVVSDLRLFEDAYTSIAHAVGGSLDVAIKHDTSTVEALQTSYDQRQARAGFWVTVMGADPAEAAAYEGFRDAPVGEAPSRVATSQVPKEDADTETETGVGKQSAVLERALTAWLALAAERWQGMGEAIEVEAEVWRLAGVLELARLPSGEALELAREVATIAAEAAMASGDRELGELFAFSGGYARSIARRRAGPPPALALAAK